MEGRRGEAFSVHSRVGLEAVVGARLTLGGGARRDYVYVIVPERHWSCPRPIPPPEIWTTNSGFIVVTSVTPAGNRFRKTGRPLRAQVYHQ